MPTDEQKQRQRQELQAAMERNLRTEGALSTLRYVEEALAHFEKRSLLGATPEDTYRRVVALVEGLTTKAETDLQDAQRAMGELIAKNVTEALGGLMQATQATQGRAGVVGSEELRKRMDAQEQGEGDPG